MFLHAREEFPTPEERNPRIRQNLHDHELEEHGGPAPLTLRSHSLSKRLPNFSGSYSIGRADGIRTRVRSFAETYLTRLGHRALIPCYQGFITSFPHPKSWSGRRHRRHCRSRTDTPFREPATQAGASANFAIRLC
jgi:hypothetical protein